MISVKEYPKNRDKFIRLKELGKEIKEICNNAGVEPVAYGGLIYFGYTKDKKAVIHDIDFLVPEKYLGKIAERLKGRKIKYHWNPEKHNFKISELIKKARIKFDTHIDLLQMGSQFMLASVLKDYPIMIAKIKENDWQNYFINQAKEYQTKILE